MHSKEAGKNIPVITSKITPTMRPLKLLVNVYQNIVSVVNWAKHFKHNDIEKA